MLAFIQGNKPNFFPKQIQLRLRHSLSQTPSLPRVPKSQQRIRIGQKGIKLDESKSMKDISIAFSLVSFVKLQELFRIGQL